MRRLGCAWAVVSIAVAGCDGLDEDPVDTRCPAVAEQGLVEIDPGGGTFVQGESSVTVTGTAEHALGLAIRRITVAGIDATSESFNFGAWAAEVPAEVIEGMLDGDEPLPVDVELEVIGYEPCTGAAPGTTQTATVRVMPAPVDGGVAD